MRSREKRYAGTGDPGLDPATGEPLGRSASAQARRGDTCHLDVVDRWGNMVAATPSGGWLQSSPVIPALGFPLGTRAQMFTVEPGLPATIAPGKRPRTTLTPSMALRDGEPYLAFGTPGGDQQDQWTLHFFLRHVHARDEPSGGDRLPGVPLAAHAVVVLSPVGGPAGTGRGVDGWPRPSSTICGRAAMT